MSIDHGNVTVLIPNKWGQLDVCPLDTLLTMLDEYDDLDKVLEDTSIDMVDPTPEKIEKVRQLNLTNDADEYWS